MILATKKTGESQCSWL